MTKIVGNRAVNPIPILPPMPAYTSPAVVLAMDRIRRELDASDGIGEESAYAEFSWFAREYPRCYRHHLECAAHRLRTIHILYLETHDELAPSIHGDPAMWATSVSNERTQRIYWDFESFLVASCNALDLLARVAGTAYEQQMPINFNKFCKKDESTGPVPLMNQARLRWVLRMKQYRDCFTHFTPAETYLQAGFVQYRDGFHMRAAIPANPSVREILGFRYSRQSEVLRYAATTWRHMTALDRAVANELLASYRAGTFPARTTGLFFV